jgi:hypothetical protein
VSGRFASELGPVSLLVEFLNFHVFECGFYDVMTLHAWSEAGIDYLSTIR